MSRGKTVAIVQARFGSSRLPGKVLEKLGDRSVLAHVVDRLSRSPGIDLVCCAIPDDTASDAVADEASNSGAVVVRGPEFDVLRRFALAAQETEADRIVRVTSDCPLADPEIVGSVASALDQGFDYACNNMPPSWPHGLDCEAFTHAALKRADESAANPEEREHVTPFIRCAADISRVNVEKNGAPDSERRWTLDYPEDLAFFRALWIELGDRADSACYSDVIAALSHRPEIGKINEMRRQRRATPGSGT